MTQRHRPSFFHPMPFSIGYLIFVAIIYVPLDLHRLGRLSPPPPVPAVNLGWPFARLGPDAPAIDRARGRRLFRACTVAWLVFSLGTIIAEDPDPRVPQKFILFAVIAIAGIAILRFVRYVEGHFSPLTIGARLRLGRLLIPGYDVVYVAPLCSFLAGTATLAVLAIADAPVNLSAALGLLVALTLASEIGPSLRTWRLTGAHRIVPGLPASRYARL